MVISAMNQVEQITQALAPMACMHMDATRLPFPFLFHLYATQKDFREMFGILARLSISMFCLSPAICQIAK